MQVYLINSLSMRDVLKKGRGKLPVLQFPDAGYAVIFTAVLYNKEERRLQKNNPNEKF